MAQKPDVAIVTGGSRGIGAATSLLLAKADYLVVVNYVSNAAAAKAVVSQIEQAGGKAVAIKGDVASEKDIVALFKAADQFGQLKVLVNNAGVIDMKARIDEMSAGRLARMFAINITGSFLCAREAVKRMSTRHGGTGGAIVNLSSAAATLGSPGMFVDYAASKGAIDVFTLGLAREVASEGIRVNAVRPGIIDTDIHASVGEPDRVAQMRGQLPMQREGTSLEVAEAIIWLASDKASYVTGTCLGVSGGRSI
ncbi:MAG: SDR family oxidoreductase [Aestuariivirga sp.]|nr:SDR family oxidoreductase [Aestuariivirga sp.]